MNRTLFSLIVVASCGVLLGLGGTGGCGGGGTEITTVGASLTLPNPIRDLPEYQVTLVLEDQLDNSVVFGPSLMVFDAIANRWEVDVENLEEADYLAVVEIVVPTTSGDFPVARATKGLFVGQGTADVTFIFNAGSFDLDLDDNGINDAESLPL